MQGAYFSYSYVFIRPVMPTLTQPSIMTYGTPWELARHICPTLTIDVPGSLGGSLVGVRAFSCLAPLSYPDHLVIFLPVRGLYF